MNALVHGFTAKVLTLPGENPQAQARAESWQETYQPEGHDEECLVNQLANAELQLQRMVDAHHEITAEQVRHAETNWDRRQSLRLLKYRRMLRRDRMTAIIHLRSFGTGVAWLLGRWRILEAAFNASQCWNDLGLIREAILLRNLQDDRLDARVGSGHEFARLAVSCVEGHEKIPALVQFLADYDDERMPCIETAKGMREIVTSMVSYIPDERLSHIGVGTLSLTEARRAMRSWIERQVADLRELDRHFREIDAQSRAGAKVRARAPEDTPRNRLLLRYMKSAENTLDRGVKTLTKLQKEREKAAEAEAEREAPAAQNEDFRNEATVVAGTYSKELVLGSCVALFGVKYMVVETGEGRVALSAFDQPAEAKPPGVASGSENGV
jgi:hypothetical protein